MKVEELIWPYCVHLYLTLRHQYIPCVFPIPLKTSNIRTYSVCTGIDLWSHIHLNVGPEASYHLFAARTKARLVLYVLFIESVGLTKILCLILWCCRNHKEKRPGSLFSFCLQQQHKSKHWNLVVVF